MKEEYEFLVGGKWRGSSQKIEIRNPYGGKPVAAVNLAQKEDVEDAIALAADAFKETKALAGYKKAAVLKDVAGGLEERREEIGKVISLESGKPIKDALAEVDRGICTFTLGSQEATRLGGEYLPLDVTNASEGRTGITRRFPIGPIAAITPFNFPLNLVAHKLSPAIASGNPVVLKPSSKTPITALILAEIIEKTDWPAGALSVLPCSREIGETLVTDQRFKMLSFTGSRAVGWAMKERAGPKKKVVLELGGNAGLMVHKDADIEFAANRAAMGAFSYAGQICISVQRIYIHEEVYDAFMDEFIGNVNAIRLGDPLDPETDVGPMIEKGAVERTKEWVEEGVKEGAGILTGGKPREDVFFEPTVMADAKKDSRICREEVFAPVVTVFKYRDIDEAFDEVDDSIYGLQAGVFTRDLGIAFKAFERLDVGGVIINDVPTFRVDSMPYGGVKESGFGREGVKYAVEEMTELKVMVIGTF